jgi:hypothetical protein
MLGHWEAGQCVGTGPVRQYPAGRPTEGGLESHLLPGLAHGAWEAAHFPQSEQQIPRQRGGVACC